jgi:hypothetical protein
MKTKGRPRGSEKDDSSALNDMADLMHADPTLKPTPAMRRHNPKIGEAEVRRCRESGGSGRTRGSPTRRSARWRSGGCPPRSMSPLPSAA